MANLRLEVPRKMVAEIEKALGTSSAVEIRSHLLSMLKAQMMDGHRLDSDTEKLLLEGLRSPLVEMTENWWDEKIARYDQRNRKRKRA